ncbi:hypothetical protein LCGC14_2141370 [marine sediment metagenome]|uniref:Ubiquitin-activating enzyme E1 FCCH domain-containing protein n=1 Tax=marine sediment metagenome TaxID=412755 RepID=A0A0F9GBI3_9ZZZZ
MGGDFGTFKKKDTFQVSINAVPYEVLSWETISTAQKLERRYDKGFIGGVGPFSEAVQSRPDQLHMAINMDTSSFPYLRLVPQRKSIDATTGGSVDGTNPTYWFAEQDTNGKVYVYMLNGRYAKKLSINNATLHSTKDFGANAVCGRPVLFEGDWCIPLGASVTATRLTTIAIDANVDSYTAFTGGEKALHFGIGMQEGIAQIIRGGNDSAQNAVDISASASSPSFGDDFEVGDSSLPITDVITVGGRTMICKADAPWYFSIDGGGNAYQITELLDQEGDISTGNQFIGSNSGAHGPYGYYMHPSGIWRILGDNAVPIDMLSEPTFSTLAWNTTTPTQVGETYFGPWRSVATYGRWLYASEETAGVWYGYINNDGSVRWHGLLVSARGTSMTAKCRVGIVNVGGTVMLYILDSAGLLLQMELATDGSIRHGKANSHGGDNEEGIAIAPQTDFGEPEKLKQVRMMWCYVDNMISANFTINMVVFRDRALTPIKIGDSITGTGGKKEGTPPVIGTSDSFYSCFPALEYSTGAITEANEDPRISQFGIRCVTPTIYRATIPIDSRSQKGRSSVFDALKVAELEERHVRHHRGDRQ